MSDRSSSPLMSSEDLRSARDAVEHLNGLTQKQATPAVLRIVRRVGMMHALSGDTARRASCLPLRAGEWAQIMSPPFDVAGASCLKIRYADPGSERTFGIADFIWETIGMDRVRLQYVERREGD